MPARGIDRIAGNANGQPITLSDLRRQLAPFVEEIGRGKSDAEFNQAIANYAEEALKQITDRQLAIAEFKASVGKVPDSARAATAPALP